MVEHHFKYPRPLFPKDLQPIAAFATTPQGVALFQPLWETGAATLWVPETISLDLDSPYCQTYRGTLRAHLETLWPTQRSLVFCLATGAVVRLVAPFLQHKTIDPAVVVVDEQGQFVISLCSGHQGGADRLTQSIAALLGATPVLTGASHALNLPGIDRLGIPFGWNRGSGDWTAVSAAIARRESVQVIQEAGSTLWQSHLPTEHTFHFGFSDHTATQKPEPIDFKGRVWISPIQRTFAEDTDLPKVQWHPRVLWVGVGCERNTPRSVIEAAIQQACRTYHLSEWAIAGIATLNRKGDEPGLLELCRDRSWPLQCFSPERLRKIPVPNPSEVVAAEVGTPSVAEAAAILACAPTVDPQLRVPKRIFRQEGQPGAVTVAIAESHQEYTGRTGSLYLVGIGPGQLDQITPAAKQAIVQADVVIGYSLYVDLIRSLLRPGQIVESWPITQERQRADRAIELAQWGLTVAVISSGDCGIYGMAGLVLEELRATEWDGKDPSVQVFPGITALQAAAARVGAPLMHDFCAISLSDLLTPWTVIEKRLTAAAQADFVTALYNPRSQTRLEQLSQARAIFLRHRSPDTPVAIVRSVYRPDEQVTLTTLGQLPEATVDMLTIVLIGNQSTRLHGDWMITPRGYLGFETLPEQVS